ncbi:MAG: 3'-5' exoribonuclease [Formivibrio sp.]|nr:3'-5' exoribonuclease [Formivibrio sp.]
MLVFLDTEFTDFIDFELISIGMVSEDGQHELYLEVQDFDRSKCNSFVQSAVWPQLGRMNDAKVTKAELQSRLRSWFATLPCHVTLACDSQHDRDLLADALDGEWPENLQGWFDFRPMIDVGIFNRAIAHYHTPDKPWHHALYDAQAHRAGWIDSQLNVSK